MAIELVDRDVLLVVDVQNDFCDGGALAVPGGQDVVPVIHRIAGAFRHVVLTQDWHHGITTLLLPIIRDAHRLKL